jgi:hypothetical protein
MPLTNRFFRHRLRGWKAAPTIAVVINMFRLPAKAFFSAGDYVQTFPVFAVERRGAPWNATRIVFSSAMMTMKPT